MFPQKYNKILRGNCGRIFLYYDIKRESWKIYLDVICYSIYLTSLWKKLFMQNLLLIFTKTTIFIRNLYYTSSVSTIVPQTVSVRFWKLFTLYVHCLAHEITSWTKAIAQKCSIKYLFWKLVKVTKKLWWSFFYSKLYKKILTKKNHRYLPRAFKWNWYALEKKFMWSIFLHLIRNRQYIKSQTWNLWLGIWEPIGQSNKGKQRTETLKLST